MDLNRKLNQSISCRKYRSRWPNSGMDVGYYQRCIHWPYIIHPWLIVAEIWTLTKNLTKVLHAENVGQGDLILVRKLATT